MQHFGLKYPLSLFESDIRREVSKIGGGVYCIAIEAQTPYQIFITLPTKLLLVILEKRLKFN